ncbi:MAP kinase phosphatase 2 [Dorcoceras hygrometricum]|uniref:MAP kinase phosphatase 2 n=1 Tax=Dorcoceras hygrometricum TaxID=472368 RepID=A0A2Z7CV59_9LAMI|nr:MAP kinase phosphatase 2 [Dorcoceras hygrometricum]
MMNSRRICPADGSQYKQSAVGLVFMESAAGLAMETSKVESAVRNQAEAKLNQLEHSLAIQEARSKEESQAGAGTMKKSAGALSVDDISSDVIIQQGATVISNQQRASTSSWYLELAIAKRFPVQARRRKTLVYVVSHTVEAGVHLWSLGVLTAAGCGIGSVHKL